MPNKLRKTIENKIKALCIAYGNLKYEKLEHPVKDTIKNFSVLELKVIVNETRNVIFFNNNYARKFNVDITDTSAVACFLSIYDVYKPNTIWIKLYDQNDIVISLKNIHKNNIEYYFEHTVIRYAILNNLPIPRVKFLDINDIKLFSYPMGILTRAFEDHELRYMREVLNNYYNESKLG